MPAVFSAIKNGWKLNQTLNHIIMLQHQKFLLFNLSPLKPLFRKELKKSLGWLSPEEVSELYHWVVTNFWETHKEEISDVFALA
jgi:hypothetical protein